MTEPLEPLEPLTEPSEPTITRTHLLIALGGLVVVTALVAVVARSRQAAVPAARPDPDSIVDGDWQASLEHLQAAFDMRLAGIDERLDRLDGTARPGVTMEHATFPNDPESPEVSPPARPAATSLPENTDRPAGIIRGGMG